MKLIRLGIMFAVLILVAGCAAKQPLPQEPTAPAEPAAEPVVEEPSVQPVQPPEVKPAVTTTDVQVLGRGGFDPSEIKIAAGSTLTFKVMDKSKHKLSQIGDASLTSPLLTEGQTFEHTFTKVGTFEVIDVVFGSRLKVVVE